MVVARRKNILICGTPGTGKSTVCRQVLDKFPDFEWIQISQYAEEKDCLDGYDDELQSPILDEDKLEDCLMRDARLTRTGKCLIDYHSAGLFPAELIDAVYVLRTDNSVLYDRLKSRGYNEVKLKENIEAEIFQVILDEAKESFEPHNVPVTELQSNSEQDMADNLETICRFIG